MGVAPVANLLRFNEEVRTLLELTGHADVADRTRGLEQIPPDAIELAVREARLRLQLARSISDKGINEGFTQSDADEADRMPALPMLRRSLATYAERRGTYGASEQRWADMMLGLFPKGLTITDRSDWVRFGIFAQIGSKLCRYTENFFQPHIDSMHDLQPYSAMLEAEDRRYSGRPPFEMNP